MSLGSTVITAYTADERFSAVCEISVVEELPVEEEPSDPRLIFGRVVILPSNDLSDIPTHYAVKIASTADVDFDVYKCDSNGNHTGNEVSDQINWTSSDTSIATVDSSGHVRGISNGSVTISVKAKLGIITVHNPIHVTVYTGYSTSHTGLAKAWVNQYKSTVTDCHDDRFVKKISPATKLSIYGYSGGYSYASIYGQSNDNKHSFFMWTQNLYDQTTGGSITICRNSDSDIRRHWDMYTTQTLYLRLTNNASCSWSTSNASVVKINNAASYTGAVATINPVAEGTAYITAQQGSKIDVIHVTTITQLASSWGITVSWCGKYKCSHLDCTIIYRKEGDTEPGKLVTIYGQSGGFYYANVQGESTYRYMWKNNISLYDWYRLREMDNHSESTFFTTGRAPQGLAIDENYCYSFEVPVKKKDNQGNILVQGQDTDGLHHRLYRYCYTTGERIQMTRTTNPNDATKDVGALYHANDACIVSFNEGNTVKPYIFVMAFNSSEDEEDYIVKLGFNDNGEYWEEARYPTNGIKFAGISLLSGGGSEPAIFLLKSGNNFYKAIISLNKADQSDVWATPPSPAFTITRATINSGVENAQAIHFETYDNATGSGNLYVAFHIEETNSCVYRNRVYRYDIIIDETGDFITGDVVNIDETNEINFKLPDYFEIEGIGFAPNQSYNRLFFSTFEGSKNAGIYRANNILR